MLACGEIILNKVAKEIPEKIKIIDDEKEPIATADLKNKHKNLRIYTNEMNNSKLSSLMNILTNPIVLVNNGYVRYIYMFNAFDV